MREPAGLVVVGIGGDDVVTIGDGSPLAVFIILQALDIGVLVAAFCAVGFFEQAAVVVAVGEDFSVGVGELAHPAEGVEEIFGLVLRSGNGVVKGVDLAELFYGLA